MAKLSMGVSQMNILTLRVAARYQIIQKVAARYKEKKQVRPEDGKSTNTIYLYSDRQIAHRNREKAKRLEKLSRSIKDLRAKVKKDLRSDDPETCLTALVVGLIDETYERVGSKESSEGALNNKGEAHYGVTQWLKKHVSFKPNGAFIKYIGKSGVRQEKRVSDPVIRKALRDAYEAAKGNDSCLFEWEGGKVTAESVNSYLSQFNDITAKDIRGLHCNNLMVDTLKRLRKDTLPKDKKERKNKLKSEFNQALKEVSEQIGHEANTLKTHYLIPHMQEAFEKDGTIINKLDD